MLSKNFARYIRSLELKKYRDQECSFVVEGPKAVADFMAVSQPKTIVATNKWYQNAGIKPRQTDIITTNDELKRVSFLQHPQQVLAIFPLPIAIVSPNICSQERCLALDRIQDPGNLGTIIRIAHWFGISTVFCGEGTADAFNPKAVQASMGSLAHVNVVYTELTSLINTLPANTPVYATTLHGGNIYSQKLSPVGLIVMGNEGNGVSHEILNLANKTLFIPCYAKNTGPDSLNVAIATAITCAEFKRTQYKL